METPISPKVYAAGVGAAGAQVLIWLLEVLTKTDIPQGIEGAISVIVVALLAWLVSDRLRDAGQSAVKALAKEPETPVGELTAVRDYASNV